MKTIKWIAFTLFLGFFLNGCELDPDHTIRVKNEYFTGINNLKIGSTSYGTVSAGTTSGYKSVDEGSHAVTGTTALGQSLTGTVSISGNGTHKWTMKITSSGNLEISED